MDPAFHRSQCTSTRRDGLSCADLADRRLFDRGYAHGHARARRCHGHLYVFARPPAVPAFGLRAIVGSFVPAGGPAVLHAIHAGAARHARHALHRAGPVAVPGGSPYSRGGRVHGAGAFQGNRRAPAADLHRGALSRSSAIQVCVLLFSAIRRPRHLVLRALAHHRPHLRRSGFHPVQHHLFAQPRPRRVSLPAPPLLSLYCRLPLAGVLRHLLCVEAIRPFRNAGLEDRVVFRRRACPDGQPARRR